MGRAPEQQRDDLSDAASSRADALTLNEEELPTYDTAAPAHSGTPIIDEKRSSAAGPTVEAPFRFPEADLPTYDTATSGRKLIAIPQTSPSATAPFLDSWSPDLLACGITEESFSSFLSTLSAFVSAKVSQQVLQHATDIGNSLGNHQKQYANNVKKSVKRIGNSAKSFNPFGVLGGTIALTVGAASHVVTSVVTAPTSIIKKPRTPRERAFAYLAAANKDWFQARGLQAMLLDTNELAAELTITAHEIVDAGGVAGRDSPQVLANGLEKWLAPLHIRDQQAAAELAESSRTAGKRTWRPQLQLGLATLWLVLVYERQ
ncbi:hypothetical protein CB0940_09360 [Cercospora beticola]|uniref:Uncharacterized protein n=1 Tax=Cercospora beticola TaxID=122368 RepID=A0A2G5HG99_CERBT|nr:hypothetical protein CB0940_09360 [Cercospora beticola]PIA91574.1 hypothetical protein CB0940_09360 [Cercospora beticola]WPB06325.1 hypothetical protein RHO25_010982 [Cercospora beticola]